MSNDKIDQLKEYVKNKYNADLYMSLVGDKKIYWRGMTRNEYKTSLRQKMNSIGMNADQNDDVESEIEECICREIIVHPTLGIGNGMLDLRLVEAGLPKQIANHFLEVMQFNPTMVGPFKV